MKPDAPPIDLKNIAIDHCGGSGQQPLRTPDSSGPGGGIGPGHVTHQVFDPGPEGADQYGRKDQETQKGCEFQIAPVYPAPVAHRRALRHPAARASASEQNHRSPLPGLIRVAA